MAERVEDALIVLSTYSAAGLPGHVYFIQGEDDGPIKIGYTTGEGACPADKRLAQIQSFSPVALEVLNTWPATRRIEADLHAIFKADRLHGEWFAPSDDLADLIWWLEDPFEVEWWYEDHVAKSILADEAWMVTFLRERRARELEAVPSTPETGR